MRGRSALYSPCTDASPDAARCLSRSRSAEGEVISIIGTKGGGGVERPDDDDVDDGEGDEDDTS
jgi:hypothetical protein